MPTSLFFLSLSSKSIPIGTAYAIWGGIGAIGTAAIGVMVFDDPVNFGRIASLALVILGILGLKAFT